MVPVDNRLCRDRHLHPLRSRAPLPFYLCSIMVHHAFLRAFAIRAHPHLASLPLPLLTLLRPDPLNVTSMMLSYPQSSCWPRRARWARLVPALTLLLFLEEFFARYASKTPPLDRPRCPMRCNHTLPPAHQPPSIHPCACQEVLWQQRGESDRRLMCRARPGRRRPGRPIDTTLCWTLSLAVNPIADQYRLDRPFSSNVDPRLCLQSCPASIG